MQGDIPPERVHFDIPVDIARAKISNVFSMLTSFHQAYQLENSRLARLICTDGPSSEALDSIDSIDSVVEGILRRRLDSQDCRFEVVCEVGEGQEREHSDSDTENLTFGWASVGFVALGSTRHCYAASDLVTYASLRLLAQGQILPKPDDPRVLLLCELERWSNDGQARYITNLHLVVNALVLWPESPEDIKYEVAFKLLRSAVSLAESCNLSIWTQITIKQLGFFRQVGFVAVRRFTLNLNHYAPRESTVNWGAKEWAQMVYHAPGENLAER